MTIRSSHSGRERACTPRWKFFLLRPTSRAAQPGVCLGQFNRNEAARLTLKFGLLFGSGTGTPREKVIDRCPASTALGKDRYPPEVAPAIIAGSPTSPNFTVQVRVLKNTTEPGPFAAIGRGTRCWTVHVSGNERIGHINNAGWAAVVDRPSWAPPFVISLQYRRVSVLKP